RDDRFAVGVETIYEGYLLHYGRSRLFEPPDEDVALLLGDALLAQGLVLVAGTGSVAAVADLAELLALCTQARAELRDARDPGPLERLARASAGDDGVDAALAAHASRLV